VTVYKESSRFYIQLLADIFTNLDQIFAALTAGTGFRLISMFDTGQMAG